MKYLFILLLVFACGTLFAQKKKIPSGDIYNYHPSVPIYTSNIPPIEIFSWSPSVDTIYILDNSVKFIKMPTGEVYKIVRETKLERVFEISGYFNSSTVPFYYQFNGDTKRLRSF